MSLGIFVTTGVSKSISKSCLAKDNGTDSYLENTIFQPFVFAYPEKIVDDIQK